MTRKGLRGLYNVDAVTNLPISLEGQRLVSPLRRGVSPHVGVADNFLAFPQEARTELLALDYQDRQGPDGQTYKRIGLVPAGQFCGYLEGVLGMPVFPGYSLARLNYAGELPNNAVHSDAGYNQYAAVLYLSRHEDCLGGTAFWKHRKTGWEFLPTEEQVREAGQDPIETLKLITESWNIPDDWELMREVNMKFNRAIVYSTRAFHSRYPFEAFGNCPENGRLVWTSFFGLL